MFCSQCGNPVKEGAKFCTHCGNRVNDHNEPVVSTPSKQQVTETISEVLWVFKADRRLSLFKIISCYIVFYSDKILFAYMTPEFQKAENNKVTAQIKADKKGFFKGSAAMMKHWGQFHKRYYTMSINEVLSEDPSNLLIANNKVVSVLFTGSEIDNSADDDSSVTLGKFNFDLTTGETLKFTHSQSGSREIKELLLQLFGNRLKYKK